MKHDDFQAIENIVNNAFDGKLESINEKISHLPTKAEFFSRMDKISGELKTMREEQKLLAGQNRRVNDRLDRHHKRITKLEHVNKLPISADD
ncbi:hypothetical protein A2154_02685 [Candidatus Gottesmanbacteria bacterium RBG_16_43_7]|uniref:Uncharacterized protein n=1 Tax=Candidatus Gottesmanbacteria bacterium RBG_16_43_7 TaxID=1798373 RepID=A0A1F5Z900_9BACT|nr:MAG: hypothetical protein A2154_02685 [Candidatus Gottesmanbacteria bacterium RBG_16_43_7]